MAETRDMFAQMYVYWGSTHHSAAFYLVSIAISVAFACIPAVIASGKGRSFALWFLFGLFCFLPALIVSIVISDRRPGGPQPNWNPYGPGQSWSPPPAGPPAGWYPDPGGSNQQRYWDGGRWTEHTQ